MTRPRRRVVVGLGAPDRGDDAVGPTVARVVAAELAARPVPGVEVLEREDPTALIDVWADAAMAVVCDAVRSGAPPGTLHVVRTGPDLPPLSDMHVQEAGTHDFGLASAVELARALGRLPEQVVVVGVEARSFDWSAPLTPAVAAAVPSAVTEVLTLLGP
ncbi:hydrogenase maturation protease [Isoptericola sp. b441]|uniref:Hydrogenase maturation protease n=1 Tax=Actinotalea lenta TaxID=3064654 RepID=A0ABT9DC85_9CELL|nr:MULTISPECIES: hydrogenase maturation protease [unclassified Isoptericola]MDO8108482.1 hydrogenase maturation protease [Isoptericola sp. b441]MDO8119901.1 hydrogenase maturation protease [Isoptericola sp. b490]